MSELRLTWKQILFPFIGYLMYFLGVGLIAGSIVHLPIDPSKYSILMVVGIVIFIAASFLNEVIIEKKSMSVQDVVRIIVLSLFLSLGIGMMSGGIQHFSEVKEYATYLIPIGFILSLFSYIFYKKIKLTGKQIALVVTICALIVIPLNLSLTYLTHMDGHAPTEEHDVHSKHSH